MEGQPAECEKCGQRVVSAVSLTHKRYLVDPEPVEGGVSADVVIFVSPSGTIRQAIPGDQAEHFRLHQCPSG
jgi:hypothetical protein